MSDSPKSLTSFARLESSRLARLRELLTPRTTKYITHTPHPKQAAFLLLGCREAFFGGAAGGGKSAALLMAALQWVDQPDYHALILRCTYAQLAKPGALMDMAATWLARTDAYRTDGGRVYRFPSGATLTFGHMQTESARYDYQGANYHYIAFDELTQFSESSYLYLFSRLRRRADVGVPIRMRAASNPGGSGHEWVKHRFITYRGPDRVYIPSRIADNPSLDAAAYIHSLSELDPITRAQLMDGDWDAQPGGRFRREWLRYWRDDGNHGLVLGDRTYRREDCACIITVDVASTVPETAKDDPDYTVVAVWYITPDHQLVWADADRFRAEVPDILPRIECMYDRYMPSDVVIEGGGGQRATYQLARRTRMPVREYVPLRDKLARAVPAMNLASSGRLWLPEWAEWLGAVQGELLRYTGSPSAGHDDCVDALSMAADTLCGLQDQSEYGFRPYVIRV